MSELAALRAALKLFANTRNEVARRAGVSETYVSDVLNEKFDTINPTRQRIIEEAKKLHAELSAQHKEIEAVMAG